MPPPQSKSQQKAPDFIPAEAPDFIPAEDNSAPADAAPDDRNALQRGFDKLTTVTPEQEAGHSWLTNKAQEFGAGAIGSLSPVFHPLQTVEGIANTVAHPVDTAKGVWADVKEHPAQTLGGIVGAATTGGLAAEAGEPLLAKIPSKARAGRVFTDVMNRAADEPVTLTKSLPAMERAQQLSARGGGSIGAIDNLYKRINTVNPLDYREARDWASNLSRLTANDQMGASPALQAEARKLSHAFNEDVGGAASRRGVGPQYDQAMKEYARASRNTDIAKKVVKYGTGAAATLAGAKGLHTLWNQF